MTWHRNRANAMKSPSNGTPKQHNNGYGKTQQWTNLENVDRYERGIMTKTAKMMTVQANLYPLQKIKR